MNSLLGAVIGSFIFAIVNVVLTSIFAVDTSDSFYGLLVQQLLVKRDIPHSDKPGLVIAQIDGLAHPILAGRVGPGP